MNLSSSSKALATNFFSLSSLQLVNMFIPFITFPYLVRVLGVETFGLLNFSLSIVLFLNLIVGFGFDLSATREISIHREEPKRLSEIFSAVFFLKLSLTIASIIFLLIYLTFFGEPQYFKLYVFTFGIVIGNLLLPTWFFQGIEQMKYLSLVNIIPRIIFTILIFVFVNTEKDYLYVPLLNSFGSIIAGSAAFILAIRKYNVIIKWVGVDEIQNHIKLSWQFFTSRIANEGSRYFATFLLGIFFGNQVVGYFSMAEKLLYAFSSLGGIVAQTLYPYMTRTKNITLFKKVFFIILLISVILLLPIIYYHDRLLMLIFGIKENLLSSVFLIIICSSVFSIASSLIGYPVLAAFGFIKYANNSLIYASIFYVIFLTFSVTFFNSIQLAAYSIILYHLGGLVLRLKYLHQTKIFSTRYNSSLNIT